MAKTTQVVSAYFGGTYDIVNENALVNLGNSPSLQTFPSTLNISNSNVSIHLESQTTIVSNINISGRVTLNMVPDGVYTGGSLSFALNSGASLITTNVTLGNDSYVINGSVGSKLHNEHTALSGTHAQINVDVVGKGDFILMPPSAGYSATDLEFTKSVSPGQTVDIGGTAMDVSKLTLSTSKFAGSVNFDNQYAQLDLAGLAKADSYSYANDVLKIYHANKVIDAVHLSGVGGFTVSSSNGSVYVAPQGPTALVGTVLPMHSA